MQGKRGLVCGGRGLVQGGLNQHFFWENPSVFQLVFCWHLGVDWIGQHSNPYGEHHAGLPVPSSHCCKGMKGAVAFTIFFMGSTLWR